MPRDCQLPIIAALVCGVCASIPSQASAQFRKGFGQGLFEVTLTRTKPPAVYLMKTGIDVQVTSQVTRPGINEQLASGIESDLIRNDPRLRLQQGKPEIAVTCNVTRLDTNQKVEMKKVTVTKRIRTDRVYNAKTKKYEDKAVYGPVEEIQNSIVVTGDISLTYQARDQATGAVIDSATFSPSYRKEFPNGTGALSSADVEQQLIRDAVLEVVQRLAPTKEPVKVQMGRPNDAIDDLNKLGQAGLWSRMREQLEKMPALSDRGKDAYRQYNIGVANEAIGYDSAGRGRGAEVSRAGLRAVRKSHRDETRREIFPRAAGPHRDGDRLIQHARAADRVLRQSESEAEPRARLAAPAAAQLSAGKKCRRQTTRPRRARTAADKGTFGNADVIDLLKSGLDEENMLAAIKDAKTVSFDLSPDGLKQLLSNKVPNRVISAMRAKQALVRPASADRASASR